MVIFQQDLIVWGDTYLLRKFIFLEDQARIALIKGGYIRVVVTFK